MSRFHACFSFGSGLLLMVYALLCECILAPIQSEVSADLLLTPTAVALISAVYLLASAAAKVPAGLLIGRYGVSTILPMALLLTGAGVWLFSSAQGGSTLIFSRSLMGVAASVIIPSLAFVARRAFPPVLFVMLMGLVEMTEGLGGILGLVCGNAAENTHGWRHSLQLLAVLAFPMVLLAVFAFSRRHFGPSHGDDSTTARSKPNTSLRELLANRQIWLGTAVYSLGMGTFCGMGGLWNVRLAEEWGWQEHLAVWIGAGLFLGVTLGSPLFGWLSMRLGAKRSLIGGLSIALGSLMFWAWMPGEWPFSFDFANTALIGLGLISVVGAFEIACHGLGESETATVTAVMNLGALLAGALCEFLPGLFVQLGHGSTLLRLQLAHGLFALMLGLALFLCTCLPKNSIDR